MNEHKTINCIEDCFSCLGANNPFKTDGTLSAEGSVTLDVLREMLAFMQECGVVSNFVEDKLDQIISEPGY